MQEGITAQSISALAFAWRFIIEATYLSFFNCMVHELLEALAVSTSNTTVNERSIADKKK